MSIKLINYIEATQFHALVKTIYYSSFDPKATMKFERIMKYVDANKAIMYIAVDNDELIGFIYIYFYKNIAYILYFAINELHRGKGYGSWLLNEVHKLYDNYILALNIEIVLPQYKNYKERLLRKKFYLKNNFYETQLYRNDWNIKTEVLSTNKNFSHKNYKKLLTSFYGYFPTLFNSFKYKI